MYTTRTQQTREIQEGSKELEQRALRQTQWDWREGRSIPLAQNWREFKKK
jgi:hypothetical protein